MINYRNAEILNNNFYFSQFIYWNYIDYQFMSEHSSNNQMNVEDNFYYHDKCPSPVYKNSTYYSIDKFFSTSSGSELNYETDNQYDDYYIGKKEIENIPTFQLNEHAQELTCDLKVTESPCNDIDGICDDICNIWLIYSQQIRNKLISTGVKSDHSIRT